MAACWDVTRWPPNQVLSVKSLFTISCCGSRASSKTLVDYLLHFTRLFWFLYFLFCVRLNIQECINNRIPFKTNSDDLTSSGNPVIICIVGIHWKTVGMLRCHWRDYIGTTLTGAATQWSFSGNPEVICTTGSHWKNTGTTSRMGCHWNHASLCYHLVVSKWQFNDDLHNHNTQKHSGCPLETDWWRKIISPVAFQCTQVTNFQAH